MVQFDVPTPTGAGTERDFLPHKTVQTTPNRSSQQLDLMRQTDTKREPWLARVGINSSWCQFELGSVQVDFIPSWYQSELISLGFDLLPS